MNTKQTTPPQLRKVLFDFDQNKFMKTIRKLTPDLLKEVKISVFSSPDENGNCINILNSSLEDKEFDALAEKAAYTLYEGVPSVLIEIGVA